MFSFDPDPDTSSGFEVNVEGQHYTFQTYDSDADDEMGGECDDVVVGPSLAASRYESSSQRSKCKRQRGAGMVKYSGSPNRGSGSRRRSFRRRREDTSRDTLEGLSSHMKRLKTAHNTFDKVAALWNRHDSSSATPSPLPPMVSGLPPLASSENDRKVLKSAAAESTVCAACGGMVPVARLDAHLRYWCESLMDGGGSTPKDAVMEDASDAGALRYLGWLPKDKPNDQKGQWY